MPAYRFPSTGASYTFGRPWTPVVKRLIIANSLIFILQITLASNPLWSLLGLQIPEIYQHMRLWQPVTYMFLHAGFWHLAFNMLALWMFGCDVEMAMGTRWFSSYYFVTGVGAGISVALVGSLAGEHSITIGASGAIFGILMAYGILFAERTITLLLFFILPVTMKARTMVLLFGVIEFLAGVGNAFGQVSHLAHLSGLLIGYLFFLFSWPELARQVHWFKSWKDFWQKLHFPWPSRKTPRIDPEEQLDAILDKISRSGINSLSKKERAILSDASRRHRQGWPRDN